MKLPALIVKVITFIAVIIVITLFVPLITDYRLPITRLAFAQTPTPKQIFFGTEPATGDFVIKQGNDVKLRVEASTGRLIAPFKTAPAGDNLLLNGDFESDTNNDGFPDNWIIHFNDSCNGSACTCTDCSATLETANAFVNGGQKSMKLVTPPNETISIASDSFPVTPGTYYVASANVSGAYQYNTGFNFVIYFYSPDVTTPTISNSSQSYTLYNNQQTQSTYGSYSSNFYVPGGLSGCSASPAKPCTRAILALYSTADSSGSTRYIDNVVVKPRDLSGILSAANISSGQFGSSSAGGNFSFYPASQVVIGANSPTGAYRLDVQGGNINSANGLCIAGSCKTSWTDVISGTVQGSGTAGKIPKFTGTSTIGDSLIYDNGTNIGIGTTVPGAKLDVVGGSVRTDTQLISTVATGTAPLSVTSTTAVTNLNANLLQGYQATTLPYVNNVTDTTLTRSGAGPYTLGINLANANSWSGAQTFTANTYFPGSGIWNTSGNVGIGTTSPNARLQVTTVATASVPAAGTYGGAAIFSNDLTTYGLYVGSISNGNGYIQQQRGDSATTYNLLIQPNGGNVGIGTTVPGYKLDVQGGYVNSSSGLCIAGDCRATWASAGGASGWTDDGTVVRLTTSTDNVGIGTTVPGAKLDVQGGNINTSGTVTASGGNSGQWNTAYTHSQAATGAEHGAVSTNTANMIVRRDASGNFSAGTITAALSGNASTATALASNGSNCAAGSFPLGVDASGNIESCTTVSSLAPTLTGGGASGTWGINVTGTAASETLATVTSRGATSTSSISVAGNLTLTPANPSITSGSSYITIPNGLYVSGGTPYFQTQMQARGGINNDSAAYLTISGGTSGYTYFSGNVGIGTTGPGYKLDVQGGYVNSSSGLCIAGDCRATWASAGGASGWTDDGTVVRLTTSTDNVGIGTASPNASGKLHISGGDNSFAYFGPNSTWGAYLWVGSGYGRPAAATASVASTNGNLHLDSGTGNDMYLNYYSSGRPIHNYGPMDSNSTITATQFNGSGAGLTGTASSLSIGGNAATATTATNQSGGTVSATTGNFSGAITASNSLWLNSGGDATTLNGILTLWSTGNTTTSQIMFKNTTGLGYGEFGGTSAGYNTYFVMDTNNRGWIFRNASTATNVAAITNMGVITATTFSGALSGNATTATTATNANACSADGQCDFPNGSYVNSSGYYVGNYINTSDDVSAGTLTYLMGKFGDNYHRSATAAKVQTFLGLGNAAYKNQGSGNTLDADTVDGYHYNNLPYLTSYTDTDTLATVTGRGGTTSSTVHFYGTPYFGASDQAYVTPANGYMYAPYFYSTGIGAYATAGSGSSGYITKWTGTYSLANSIIYDNGTNVGIGTTGPGGKLDVSNPGSNVDGIVISPDANGDNSTSIQAYIDNNWANRVTYAGGCCNNIALQPDVGTVTIGSNPYNPSYKFSVYGTGYFSGTVTAPTFSGNATSWLGYTSVPTWNQNTTGTAGSTGVLTGNAYTNGSDGWFRSNGAAGWYSASYAVGVYATQAGRVDLYNGASLYVPGGITSVGTVTAPTFSGNATSWLGYTSVPTWNQNTTGNAATADKTNGYGAIDAHPGTGMRPFYNWGGTNCTGSAPSAGCYTTGIAVGSHPSDQAYGFEIAQNMWDDNMWTKKYASGYGTWRLLCNNSNNCGYLTANQSISLTGDVTGSGTTSISTTIAANAVTGAKIADNTITAADLASGDFSTKITSGTYSITVTNSTNSNYGRYVYDDGLHGGVVGWKEASSLSVDMLDGYHYNNLPYLTGYTEIDPNVPAAAKALNQYVNTNSNPTFGTVYAALSGNASTVTNGVYVNGSNYVAAPSWISMNGNQTGLYWPNWSVASYVGVPYWYPNYDNTYGAFSANGYRNGYVGINWNSASGTVGGMFDTAGNGGDWDSTTGWHYYWNRANTSLGVGGSTTASGYKLYVNGNTYGAGTGVFTGTVTAPTFSGALSGNASTATALTSMNISQFTNNSGYLTGTKVDSFNGRTGAVSLSSGDVTGALGYTPYNSTNPSGYITAGSTLTGLVQSTAAGNSYFTGGNVGIGTTSPSTKLSVTGGGISTDSFFSFTSVQQVAPPHLTYINAPRSLNLGFFPNGTEAMTINSSNNVGIGTTGPGASLEVAGTGAKFSGTIAAETHTDANLYAGVLSGTARIIFGQATTTHEIDNYNASLRFFRPAGVDMLIDGNGNTTFNGTVTINSWAAATGNIVCRNGNTISSCTSSQQFKHDVSLLSDTELNSMYDEIKQMNIKSYMYNNDPSNRVYYGLIAEEAPSRLQVTDYKADGTPYTNINFMSEWGYAFAGIKVLDSELTSLKNQVANLSTKVDSQQKQIEELRKTVEEMKKK